MMVLGSIKKDNEAFKVLFKIILTKIYFVVIMKVIIV